MRQTNSTLLTFVAIIVFLFLLLDWNGKKEPEGCKNIVKITDTHREKIYFCQDNGLVYNPIDSVWTEPSLREERKIRTYFKEE